MTGTGKFGDGLAERLEAGHVICAEGYLFELERRGYLQAGGFVPEVVLDHPEKVLELHREFVHAGSDVVEAFTYYAHREKLRLIGKEDLLEQINRQALGVAAEVARDTGTLLAGNICNTNLWTGPKSRMEVQPMFEEQIAWAVDAEVDFVIAETISWGEEAIVATEAIKAAGLPAVVTLAMHRTAETREGWSPAEACRRLEHAGADVVGLNCSRGPATMLPLLAQVREAVDGPVAALPVPYRTTPEQPSFQSLRDPLDDDVRRGSRLPHGARSVHVHSLRHRRLHPGCLEPRCALSRGLLRRGPAPHPRDGRGPRTHASGESILGGHDPACLLRHRPLAQDRLHGARR